MIFTRKLVYDFFPTLVDVLKAPPFLGSYALEAYTSFCTFCFHTLAAESLKKFFLQ